ncbi:uncharacterized protein TNCV_2499641 [Trichonephila clavipes]|nr:uncharacterized protein TNCV_2499641 [Trichonephila clavipes]
MNPGQLLRRKDHVTTSCRGRRERPELWWHAAVPKFTCRNCGGGDRGRVALYRPFGEVSLSLNRTVTCMVLKANDRCTSCPCHDEFRGPRSDYVRQAAVAKWYRIMACFITSSSPVPLKTCRVGQRCMLNLSRVEMSSHWCGHLEREVPAQVSSTSLDHGSKLRGPSPKALV